MADPGCSPRSTGGAEPDRRVAGSFRDPAGFVFERDGVVYRQVAPSFAEHYDRLMGSGLHAALVERGLLVDHDEVDTPPAAAPAHRVLRPERVPFVSFPYEWCPGQLRGAALATLEAQLVAMDHGMSLRDASAYNVQFLRGAPVLIDTLSFEVLPTGQPWVAYRQFCQHFLAPLALMCQVDVRLGQLLRSHLDGIPLDLASRLLPGRSKLSPGLGIHIHQHARSQRRHADGGAPAPGKAGRFSEQAFRGLLDSLRGTVGRQTWEPSATVWRDYDAERPSYSDESFEHKTELVAKLLGELSPSVVWDLGANTGRFSRLAASTGASVVSLEADPSAVELSWRQVHRDGETTVLPLIADLANPSPGLGWEHEERPSLTDRGPADVALALALIHHLAISNNLPLDRVAAWFRRLTSWLLVEWVPKSDVMVRRLLVSREDVFDGYTQEGFEAAVDPWFTVERREPLRGSERTLYLLHGRSAAGAAQAG
ncbi:MAG: SAM-dependent methyltransferase [Egibacteraceae bacterium]